MSYPSPNRRAAMSALSCLIVPTGVVFWMAVLDPLALGEPDQPIARLTFALFWVHVVGLIPCAISWFVGVRPFVIQGEKWPTEANLSKLAGITAMNGACWGLLFVLAFGAPWVWFLALTLAWCGPGLAYGAWLQRKVRRTPGLAR